MNYATSQEAQRQFEREAGILARLSHPNLPRVTDYFFIPEQGQVLVMDFVEGEDLQALLNRLGAVPEAQAVSWVGQVCDALSYLHSQPSPIIHRDVKPANIKIRSDGRAMLVDFGIAKIYDPAAATTMGARAVTPGYSPPEQYGGAKTDSRSDIYALGATCYHLLTGQMPPESVRRMVDAAAMPSPRQLNQSITPLAERAVLRAVEIGTDSRFQSVEDFRAALTGSTGVSPAVRGSRSESSEAVGSRPAQRQYPRGLLWALAGGVGVAMIVVVAVTLLALSGAFTGDRASVTSVAAAQATEVPTTTATVVPTRPLPTATSPPTQPAAVPTEAAKPSPEALELAPMTTATRSPEDLGKTPTPSPQPSLSPSEPTPTETFEPSPTPVCSEVTGPFSSVWQMVRSEIGCATNAAVEGQIAEERFERGRMFWREPVDHAQGLVLFNEGTWRVFQHAPYAEGSPEFSCPDADTPAQCPPTPKRGFGLLWCEIPEIRDRLGNAADCERGYRGAMQEFDRGFMLQTDIVETYVFYSSGRWERR